MQHAELGHALAIDGTPALFHGSFDATILGQRLDALGVDLLALGIQLALVLRVFRSKAGALSPQPREFFGQRYLLVGKPGLPPLGRGDTLLLLVDGAAALLHLLDEVFLDLALRPLRGMGQARELLVVGFPAVCIEQRFRFFDLPLLGECADIGDHFADLVDGADFCGPLTGLGRKYRVEMGVEGEEDGRRHRGEEHYPEYRILRDDPHRLRVWGNHVALGEEHQQDDDAHCGGGQHKALHPQIRRNAIAPPKDAERGEQAHTGKADHNDHQRHRCACIAPPVNRTHADRKAFPDQPGHDQHHALNTEGDQHGKPGLVGEIAQARPRRVAGRQRQRDARGGQQRELPVREEQILDDPAQPGKKSRASQDQKQNGAGNQKLPVAHYERGDAIYHRHQVNFRHALRLPLASVVCILEECRKYWQWLIGKFLGHRHRRLLSRPWHRAAGL